MKTTLSRTGVLLLLFVTGCASTSSPSRFGLLSLFGKRDSDSMDRHIASSHHSDGGPTANGTLSTDSSRAGTTGASAADPSLASPNSITQSLELGRIALVNQRLQEAKVHFEHVLAQRPKHVEAHHQLGIICDQLREFDAAQSHYHAALAGDPTNPDILSDIGYSKFLQNRLDESEKYLLQAVKYNPAHQHALNNLGLLYAKRGDYDLALARFREAGTEEQAQANIAKLFPQGRPFGASVAESFGRNARPPQDQQGFADSSTAPMPAYTNSTGENGRQVGSNGSAPPFPFVQNDNAYLQTGGQQSSAGSNPNLSSTQSLTGSTPWPGGPQAAYGATQMNPPAGAAATTTGAWGNLRDATVGQQPLPSQYGGDDRDRFQAANVPDAQINQVLSEIDAQKSASSAQPDLRAGRPFGQAAQMPRSYGEGWNADSGPAQFASAAPKIRPRNPDRPDVNPLDSMPPWNSSAEVTGAEGVRNAAGEFAESTEPSPSGAIRQAANIQSGGTGQTGSMPPQWPYSPQAAATASRQGVNSPYGDVRPTAGYDLQSGRPGTPSTGLEGNAVMDVTQAAARLGMAAGPGQMFPIFPPSESNASRSIPGSSLDARGQDSTRSQWPTTTPSSYGGIPQYGSAATVRPSQTGSNFTVPGAQQYTQASAATNGGNQSVRAADWSSSVPSGRGPIAFGAGESSSPAGYGGQRGEYARPMDSVIAIPDSARFPAGNPPTPRSGYEGAPLPGYDAANSSWPDQYRQPDLQPSYRDATSVPSTGSSFGSGPYNP